MVSTTPNPIKEYYIAYFDILGYKDFFRTQAKKVPELLDAIHRAIEQSKKHIENINHSSLLNTYAKIELKVKLFSDNALICMEASNELDEPIRALAFIKAISNIQRGFVLSYGLFVRGGITKGQLSFNDDYVFGQGLIDAVGMEESAQYPRIVISPSIINYLQSYRSCSQEDIENALSIEKRMSSGETVTNDECAQYEKAKNALFMDFLLQKAVGFTVCRWNDDCWIVDYLHIIDIADIFGQENSELLCKLISDYFPKDAAVFMPKAADSEQDEEKPAITFDFVLHVHKVRVEEKLKKYGHNNDIALGDVKQAELREKVLRKYIWVMAFHNRICETYKKTEYSILTRSNCDTRFLKTTIEVIEDEAGI